MKFMHDTAFTGWTNLRISSFSWYCCGCWFYFYSYCQ